MAFTVSRSRIAPVLAKRETTYGTDAGPVDGTDDLLTINSPNPFETEFDTFEVRPHGNTFTRQKDIIGARVARVRVSGLAMGSGSAGVEAVNGFGGLSSLLCAAGNQLAIVATTSLTYTPATIANIVTFQNSATLKSGSATIWANLNGMVHKAQGCWGNLTLSGNPRGPCQVDFDGFGIYVAPAAETASEWNTHTGGTNRAQPFLNVSGSISAGTPYAMNFKSMRFDGGVQVERVMDANSATGLASLLFADRNPTLEVVIGLDVDGSAAVSYPLLHSQLTASTTHIVEWALPGGAGNNMQFNHAQAQLLNLTRGEENGHRTVTIRYKVQHVTNEGEYDWAIT